MVYYTLLFDILRPILLTVRGGQLNEPDGFSYSLPPWGLISNVYSFTLRHINMKIIDD